jgi:hypothetical protein
LPWIGQLLCTAGTFAIVAGTFVLFRASGLRQAVHLYTGIVQLRPGPVNADAILTLAFAAAALAGLDMVQRARHEGHRLVTLPAIPTGVAVGAMVAAVIVFSGAPPVPFIYFKF